MDNLPSHYRTLPDGRIQDLRYRFSRGTSIRVASGPHRGTTGTMESACFDLQTKTPVYTLVDLEPKRPGWIRVRWDELEDVG